MDFKKIKLHKKRSTIVTSLYSELSEGASLEAEEDLESRRIVFVDRMVQMLKDDKIEDSKEVLQYIIDESRNTEELIYFCLHFDRINEYVAKVVALDQIMKED